jgi:hypothetical protein
MGENYVERCQINQRQKPQSCSFEDSLVIMRSGQFFRIHVERATLPDLLIRSSPQILWIPHAAFPGSGQANQGCDGQMVISGQPIEAPDRSGEYPLVWITDQQQPHAAFSIAHTIDEILLERYHDGLQPTLEMRLPFNYSRLPSWAKSLGRRIRGGSLITTPKVMFPDGDPSVVVDWLRDLAAWCSQPQSPRSRSIQWPQGHRAALTIAHDVDNDWVFQNPYWLDRFLDLEESFELHGAWYCVPKHSESPAAVRGFQRLRDRHCEIGCHGYNHDARWPLLADEPFQQRLREVQEFQSHWQLRGFRSEWLWRDPRFLKAIAGTFEYDTSVPTVATSFTRLSRNGCGTCLPYLTWGGMLELPVSLPLDDQRYCEGAKPQEFWERQSERAKGIVASGGLVMLSLHPQPHQAANDVTLAAVRGALQEISALPGVWKARPDEIADWCHTFFDGAEDH